MKIEIKKIEDLILSNYNPRKDLKPGDKEYEDIKNSIEKFGYVQPIILNTRNNVIVGGNQRLKVLKDLGYKQIDCVLIDVDENDEKALNIALNKIDGAWDDEKLKELINDLHEVKFDMKFTGFNSSEVDNMLNDLRNNKEDNNNDDSFDEEKALDKVNIDGVKTKKGNLYKLGNHFLLCGDSLNENDRRKLIKDKFFDVFFSDPPYDMEMGGSGCLKKNTENLKKRIDKLIEFDVNKLNFLPEVNVNTYYLFTSKNSIKDYFKIFNDYNFNILIWGKSNPTPWTNNQFLPDIEYIMYFANKDRIWNNSLKPTEIYKKYFISNKESGRKEDGDLHPTMKPLEIISNRLRISSNENGNVLDLFGGSGSTLIVSEQLSRNCYMMELEPVYCDVIINRYIKYKNSSEDVFLIDGKKKISWEKYIKS